MLAAPAPRHIGRIGTLLLGVACASPAIPVAATAAVAAVPVRQDATPTEIPTSAAIEAVTLYPGRASVTRVARPPALKPGLWLLRFDDLPPTIQPDTLEARTSSGRVLAVDFTSRPTADRSGTPEAKVLDSEIRTLEGRIALNTDSAAALESERKLIDMVTLRTGNDATKEGGTDKLDLAVLDRQLTWVREQRARVATALRELVLAQEELGRQLDAARARRAELGGGRTTQGADVLVALTESGTPGVELTYLVRNAGWQPVYAVRAMPAAGTASVDYEALITQSTGENWNEVKLTLSTAQPTKAATPPPVQPWSVDVWVPPPVAAKVEGAYGGAMPRAMRSAAAPGEPVLAYAVADASAADARAAELAERFSADASVGGDGPAMNFSIVRPVSAPSDAAMRTRARIATVEGPAKFVYQTQPLVTEGAFLRGSIVNGSAYQMLPGRATIFVGADYIGSADFAGAAPKQSFDVFFGTDPSVTVKRELLGRDQAQSGLFGGGLDTTWNYRGSVINGTGRTIAIEWIDRMPTSRSDKIQVSLPQPSAPLSTNAGYVASDRPRGILRWDLSVPPSAAGAQPFTITWKVLLSRSKDIETTPLPEN
jgi:uncharacterized protein (TIGR02231 family)